MAKTKNDETYQYREIDLSKGIQTLVRHGKGIIGFTVVATLGIFLLGMFSIKTTFQGNVVLSIGNIGGEATEAYNQIVDTLIADKNVSTEKSGNEKTISIKVEGSSSENVKEKTERLAKEILDRHIVTRETKIKAKETIIANQIETLNQSLVKNQRQMESFQVVFDRLSASNFVFEGQAIAAQGYLNALNALSEKEIGIKERLQALQSQLPITSEESKQTKFSISPNSPAKRITVITISGALLALFVSSLWAFVEEWWKENRLRARR